MKNENSKNLITFKYIYIIGILISLAIFLLMILDQNFN